MGEEYVNPYITIQTSDKGKVATYNNHADSQHCND